jgi:hypothetical protein
MSYLETEYPEPPLSGPGWVDVLFQCDGKEDIEKVVLRFDDDSLEWHRGSRDIRALGGLRDIGNQMMPLGYMIMTRTYHLADAFLERFGNVHDVCLWYDGRSRTPLQEVTWSGNPRKMAYWMPLLWEHGVSVAEIRSMGVSAETTLLTWDYTERESNMLALAWTCRQIKCTSWGDCSEPIVKRMRRLPD